MLIMMKSVRFKQPYIAIEKLINYFEIYFHIIYCQDKILKVISAVRNAANSAYTVYIYMYIVKF